MEGEFNFLHRPYNYYMPEVYRMLALRYQENKDKYKQILNEFTQENFNVENPMNPGDEPEVIPNTAFSERDWIPRNKGGDNADKILDTVRADIRISIPDERISRENMNGILYYIKEFVNKPWDDFMRNQAGGQRSSQRKRSNRSKRSQRKKSSSQKRKPVRRSRKSMRKLSR